MLTEAEKKWLERRKNLCAEYNFEDAEEGGQLFYEELVA